MRRFKQGFLYLVVSVALMMLICPFAAADDPVVLKFSSYLPPSHHLQASWQWVADQIEARTDGSVKIRMFTSGSLHGSKQGFEALRSGITDITPAYPAYEPTGFNLAYAGELPFKFPNAQVMSRVMDELYPKYIKAEYEKTGAKLAFWCNTTNYLFVATRKPVKSLADLKGMKIRSPGLMASNTLKALGAVPVMMPTPEIYEGIERGVVDGTFLTPSSGISYRLYEVGKYLNIMPVSCLGIPVAIRPKAWEKLTPEQQAIVFQVFREGTMDVAEGYDEESAKAIASWEKQGGTVVIVDAEEIQKCKNAVAQVDEAWIARCAKAGKGEQAKQMLQELDLLVKKYEKMPLEELRKEHMQADMEKMMSD